MKTKVLLTIILFCAVLTGFAQTASPDRSVRGVVIDSATRKPVDIITVNLKSAGNQLLRTAVTRADGIFSFEKLTPGNYTISLISIGYAPKIITADLSNAPGPALDLGTIQITSQGVQLATVSIRADKPIVKQEIDKLTYDLQADPESKSNNVLDMMRKVPMLMVDGEENIKLNGNTNYKIFINGKPSGMMESDPKNVLRSMPASTIQSIEVITNPPAKYDAEGFGGIINIVTIKRTDNGYNGTANVSQRGPVSAGPGAGFSLSYKQGKFGLNLNAGGALPDNPIITTTAMRITTGASPTDLLQVNERNPNARNGFVRGELSYEIDSLNLIATQLSTTGGGSDIAYEQSSVLSGSSGVTQGNKQNSSFVNRVAGIDASLNYQLGFKSSKARLLTFSYRLYKTNSRQNADVTISDRINYTLPDYVQYNKGQMFEQTFQVDYVHPVKKLNIEGGIKGILRDNRSNFQYQAFNTTTGNYQTDPARSNRFDNDQNVYGAYNSYSYNFKSWAFKAGMRVEFTTIDADFVSTSSQLKHNFFNIIPTASVQRKFGSSSSVVLSYNQRISRPGISQLNPFVDRSNPDFESAGNPNLRPVVANNVQLSYSSSKKLSLTMGVGYNFYNNQIMQVISFNPLTNVTRSSYENTGKGRWLTFSTNAGYPITKAWNMNLNGQVTYGRVQGLVNGTQVMNEGSMYGVSAGTGYRFGKGWMTNMNASWNSASLSLQGSSNTYASWSLAVSKDIVKDRLSFSASIANPFDQFRTNINESFGPGFKQINTSETYFRQYSLSLNYRFGKLKEAIKKNKRSINNDDL
jgi:ferric enterobactin receptor